VHDGRREEKKNCFQIKGQKNKKKMIWDQSVIKLWKTNLWGQRSKRIETKNAEGGVPIKCLCKGDGFGKKPPRRGGNRLSLEKGKGQTCRFCGAL